MDSITKGTRFLHRHWLNSRLSLDEIKTMAPEDKAQEFVVTAIRQGVCYYRPVYRHSDREDLGSTMKHPVDRMAEYVLLVIS